MASLLAVTVSESDGVLIEEKYAGDENSAGNLSSLPKVTIVKDFAILIYLPMLQKSPNVWETFGTVVAALVETNITMFRFGFGC